MSALSDTSNVLLRDVEAEGDVRDDPRWRALLGQGRKRRRVKRNYVRDSEGQFAETPDVIPGDGGGKNPLDKLKGAGHIDLEPGERLLRSDRMKGENGRAWLAVTEKDGKRSLRIGLGNAQFGTRNDHGGPWRAGPDRTAEINEERAELRAEIEDLENEIDDLEDDPNADPADITERREQLEKLYGTESGVDESPGGHTAMLDESSARRLRETLAKALDDGKRLQAELDKPYEKLDSLTLERDKLKRNAMGRKFTDEEDAEWDRLTAEIARAEAELDPDSGPERPTQGYWTLAEGSIPGQWADVHYDIYLDDPDVGVEVKLGAVPHGSDMDFDDLRGAEMTASFDFAEAQSLARLLAKMESGDQSKGYRGHLFKHPGHSPQSVHGNHHSGGIDLNPNALDGIEVYSLERYQEIYGDILDEEGVKLTDDGVYLTAKYFKSRDAHVSWDLPGEEGVQVLEEMDPSSMRKLADDIEGVLEDYDYGDFDPDDYEAGDILFDVDSNEHDFYIGVDKDGDVRIRPESSTADEQSFFEISAADARAFAAALNNMADGYEDHFDYGGEDDAAKTRSQSMNIKTMRATGFEVKNADRGEFSAVLATLGVIDSDGDVTEMNAFDGSDFPISAYGHKSWEGALPVGVGRVKEVGNQIIVEGSFFMDTTHGRDTFTTVKRLGPLGQWSYGYDVLDHSMGMHEGKSVRFLKKLKVHEASPVLVGAGVGTRTLGTKGNRMRINRAGSGTTSTAVRAVKGAIPAHETKTASRPWDNARTVKALPEDSLPSELRTVFGWVDPEGDPEDLTSYKMAHHHGIGGPANVRACLIGIAQLNDGTADIPESDRKSVYDHLAGHLKDADHEPPALRTDAGVAVKNLRFGDEAASVLAGLSGLIDRATEVMALRRTKGKGMAASTADLLSWVGDEMARLKSLLSNPVEHETPHPDDDEIASVVAASIARLNGITAA